MPYPKPQNKRVLLEYCVSLKPSIAISVTVRTENTSARSRPFHGGCSVTIQTPRMQPVQWFQNPTRKAFAFFTAVPLVYRTVPNRISLVTISPLAIESLEARRSPFEFVAARWAKVLKFVALLRWVPAGIVYKMYTMQLPSFEWIEQKPSLCTAAQTSY